MSDQLECPYCEALCNVDHDDGEGYEEGKPHQMECDHCHKNFVYYTSISYDYHPSKADCLNGWDHNYMPVHSGLAVKIMMCEDCGEKKTIRGEKK